MLHQRSCGAAFSRYGWTSLGFAHAPLCQAQAPANEGVLLRYQAPPDCPDEAAFIMLVQARTGAKFPNAKHPTSVEVERDEKHLRGTMLLLNAEAEVLGERTLKVGKLECDALVEAFALTAASLLTGQVAEQAKSEDRTASSLPPPVPPPWPKRPPVASTGEEDRQARPPTRWNLGIGPWFSLGRTPAPLVGGSLGVGAHFESLYLGVGAMVGLQPHTHTLQSGDRVDASLVLGSLNGCFVQGLLRLCAAFDIGALNATVLGSLEQSEKTSILAAIGFRPSLQFELGSSIFLRPWLGVQASLVRPAIFVADEQVWAMPVVSGGAGAEVGLVIE